MANARPHVIGIDDGPFEKGQSGAVAVVGVMMECPWLVEGIAHMIARALATGESRGGA